MSKTAIIIGAGPAGLTAAYELVTKTDIQPIILEKSNQIGGISKTVEYNGNRIDIGGHLISWWDSGFFVLFPGNLTNSGNADWVNQYRI